MLPERYPPDDPREWLNRARSNLARADIRPSNVYLEDLCFDAQQAAEKAIKAVLIWRRVTFPYVHDLAELVSRLEQVGEVVPAPVREAVTLTQYAVIARYPGLAEPVTSDEHLEAVRIAAATVRWAERLIGMLPRPD